MKIKAFTILEALISLILISIIIGLVITLLTFFDKQVLLFTQQNNEELTYNLFDTTLKRDVSRAHNYSVNNNQIALENYDDTTIIYSITQNHILREHQIGVDTFKIKVANHKIIRSQLHTAIRLDLEVLSNIIRTNYFLTKDPSNTINTNFYNED